MRAGDLHDQRVRGRRRRLASERWALGRALSSQSRVWAANNAVGVTALAFTPNNGHAPRLLCSDEAGDVVAWNLGTPCAQDPGEGKGRSCGALLGAERASYHARAVNQLGCVAMRHGPPAVVTCSDDRTVKVSDLASLGHSTSGAAGSLGAYSHATPVVDCHASEADGLLCSLGGDGSVRLADTRLLSHGKLDSDNNNAGGGGRGVVHSFQAPATLGSLRFLDDSRFVVGVTPKEAVVLDLRCLANTTKLQGRPKPGVSRPGRGASSPVPPPALSPALSLWSPHARAVSVFNPTLRRYCRTVTWHSHAPSLALPLPGAMHVLTCARDGLRLWDCSRAGTTDCGVATLLPSSPDDGLARRAAVVCGGTRGGVLAASNGGSLLFWELGAGVVEDRGLEVLPVGWSQHTRLGLGLGLGQPSALAVLSDWTMVAVGDQMGRVCVLGA